MKHDYKKQGKRNRANGAAFERRVRKDLEEKGWIVSKWQNNLDYPKENINLPSEERKDLQCISAKASRFRLSTTGFPDFFCYKTYIFSGRKGSWTEDVNMKEVVFVEVKTNGYMDKLEKEKAKWYLENNYCSKFLVAKKEKVKNRIKVIYKEF